MSQFPATIELSSLDGATGFKLTGAPEGATGWSVSSAGDVNGDGFDDMIVGALGAGSTGASYVVFGKAGGFASTIDLSSLDGTTGFRLTTAARYDYSSYSVSSAGDVNGDGFDDVIVGAPLTGGDFYGQGAPGASYVVFGKAGGFSSNVDLSSLDGTTGFRLTGEGGGGGDESGCSVSSAGDVNGDGFDDMIVGARGANGDDGASYVVFGKAGGFSSTIALSSLDGTNGFKLMGFTPGPAGIGSGQSVSSAGDVNGDGFDDVIVGAFHADPNGISSGASYVVFGKAGGFASAINLSSLDGTTGFRLTGAAAGDESGWSVSSAGDVNGDGFADLIVGARFADPNGVSSGASYVVFGKAGGFASTINLSSLDGTTGFRLTGVAADDRSGSSVSSAGDVNGDGFDDVIVGTQRVGSSYVVFGKAGGFSSTIDLSSLDGTNGFSLTGEAFDWSGFSVSSAGDVNDDGFDDLIVGAPSVVPNGASYVIFGRAPDEAVNRIGTSANQTLAGGAFADTLDGAGGDDELHGNGGNDTLIGGDGGDTLIGGDGKDRLNGGGDADSLNGGADADGLTGGLGNDTLVGGLGADVMSGGAGDDLYAVDDVGDQVVEGSDQGTDTVRSSVAYALGDNVENLVLTGAGAIDGAGNALANRISGNASANILLGAAGNDTLVGGGGDDTLGGGQGDDSLNGGGGDDSLNGGGGNDLYVVDDAGDQVVEGSNQGTDTVRSSIAYALGDNIENLALTGTSAIDGAGNALANRIAGNASTNILLGAVGNDTLIGGGGDDTLKGGGDNDSLSGGDGADALFGAAGGDSLHGGLGDDSLNGGGENDSLIGGAGNDVLAGGGGADSLEGNFGSDRLTGGNGDDSLTGGFDRDNLLGGAGKDVLAGDAGEDALRGGEGDDSLNGGFDKDRLTGDAGADSFVFTSSLAGNVDRITDFTVGEDRIVLENAIFAGLPDGALSSDAFHTGTAAADASDRIIYNTATGALFYDRDGSGTEFAAQKFASVGTGLALSQDDFWVI